MKRVSLLGFVSLFMFFVFSHCEENENLITTAVKVDFKLTDAPADFEEVNIEIVGLRYHNEMEGWVDVEDFNPGIYDLLKLRNGVDTLLGSAEILSGHISQIRLMLGSENSVVIDGDKKPLFTPSAQQSGIKVLVNKTFSPGRNQILLDFDAARSVVSNPNKFILKPVIRIIETETTGAVQGRILPLGVASVVYLQNSTDTLSAYPNQENGKFLIKGAQPGSYQLKVVPESPYGEVIMENVPVIEKITIDIGTITLK